MKKLNISIILLLTWCAAFATPPSNAVVTIIEGIPPIAISPSVAMSARFGPTFEQLNPNAVDNRPTLYCPPDRVNLVSYSPRMNPYQVGAAPDPGYTDYWSESGQVAYIPDGTRPDDIGLCRFQCFAQYNRVFTTCLRWDMGNDGNEPLADGYFINNINVHGRFPVAIVRNYAQLSNDAVVLYEDGLIGGASTQTGHDGDANWPLGCMRLPANKRGAALALTTNNELLLVALTDTTTGQGQIAVIACEGRFLAYHTWPYIGLLNQGSWSDFKLLGYVDVPFHPDSIAAASNGWWGGPGDTNNQVLSQINLANPATRSGILNGEYGWQLMVANKGYAICSSKAEGKVAIIDLAPTLNWLRLSWLNNYDATATGRAAGTWPGTLTTMDVTYTTNPPTYVPANSPTLIWSTDADRPTCVLAGLRTDRWSTERHKAYYATESGRVFIIDASTLMQRWGFEVDQAGVDLIHIAGSFQVGRNPVSMCFARFRADNMPAGGFIDPTNNAIHFACRGDRRIDSAVVFGATGIVYQSISDRRMGDPVAVSVAGRGNIMTVADFNGKKLVGFRLGSLWRPTRGWSNDPSDYPEEYPCGGGLQYEFAGELPVRGWPFGINSANVN